MGVGTGLYMYVVVVQKFTFAISSPDEFLLLFIVVFCFTKQNLNTADNFSIANAYCGYFHCFRRAEQYR